MFGLHVESVLRIALLTAVSAVFVTPVPAQNMFGRISGTVTDPSGAAIAGGQCGYHE